MATLTIRNIDENTKTRLRSRAAKHGHSMEEEARAILKRAVDGISGPELWELSRQLFQVDDGIELALPRRVHDRDPPNFDGPDV